MPSSPSLPGSKSKRYIIIGAGPSGLFAARELIRQGADPKNINILEKEPRVGGKCQTYSDPKNRKLKTEVGACIVLSNYRYIVEAIKEKNIITETLLTTAHGGIPISHALETKATSYSRIIAQLKIYFKHVARYQAERYLPTASEDLELSFDVYAKKHGMPDIPVFLKHFVPGFGYGPMEVTPAHSIFAYIGRAVIFDIIAAKIRNPIVTIKNGFQHLMERIAEDFSVTTSAHITKVMRSAMGVRVELNIDSHPNVLEADTLILATSPQQWPSLNMPLTPTEQACVDELECYRYPVAVCNIQGLGPEHHFFAEGLEYRNFKENLGELALITIRDARPTPREGRLCTLYQSLPLRNKLSPPLNVETERALFAEKICELEKKYRWRIKVQDYKVWTDYLPHLPITIRRRLEKEQMSTETHTLHLGAYVLGGFDNTECVAEQAVRGVKEHIFGIRHSLARFADLKHARNFFWLKSVPPVSISPPSPSLSAPHIESKSEAEDYASIPSGVSCAIQ